MTRQELFQTRFTQSLSWVRFRNTDTESAPAYAAMAVHDTDTDEDTGELIYLVRRCTEADEQAQNWANVLINGGGTVAQDKESYGSFSLPNYALIETAVDTRDQHVGIARDKWELVLGGGCFSVRQIKAETGWPRLARIDHRHGPTVHFKTQSEGISAYSSPAYGTGIVDLLYEADGDEETTNRGDDEPIELQVYHRGDEVSSDVYGQATQIGDKWFVTSLYC